MFPVLSVNTNQKELYGDDAHHLDPSIMSKDKVSDFSNINHTVKVIAAFLRPDLDAKA